MLSIKEEVINYIYILVVSTGNYGVRHISKETLLPEYLIIRKMM